MNKNILLLIALIATLLTTTAQVCENIDAGDDVQMLCSDADATLTTTFIAPNYRRTTNYDINSQPLCPPVTYDGSRTFIQTDDEWSDFVIDIPFTFCFFENQYDQLLISGNGMVTFDLTMLNQGNDWQINAADQVPTTNWETNSIFGVYHDMNSNVQPREDRISYKTVGTAPNRIFIISFECLQYSCTTLLSKSQIKLYESSNVIDVRVDEKPVCNAWNGGRAVIGIQNKYGTVGVTPAGRENGVWTPPAGGELWRFVPNGDAMGYTLNWFDDNDATNTILNVDSVTGLPNNSESITVNPQQETTYRVELTLIDQCNDATSVLSDTVIVTPGYDPSITDPIIINECETTTGSGVADFDLDQNALILTGLNAADFNITYHPTEQDAIDNTAAITPLSPFNSAGGITIWVRIEDVGDSTCYTIRSFDINVISNSVSISYPSNSVCSSTNATYLPDTISITGGTFTIDNGGVIDAVTGEIDVVASGVGTDGTGDFIIHYEIVASSCTVSTDFNLAVTLQDNTTFGYTSAYAATPADFCKNDANPTPNPAPAVTGGTYSINNGGTIDAVTGEIDLTVTPASNTPYTVEYATGGTCGNTSTFDITIHSNESAAFNYNVSYCLSNATNPMPTVTGTGSGTFTITLQGGAVGGTINAGTGEIDLGTTPAGIYTITYTTPGTFCSDTETYDVTIYASPLIDTPTNAVENACESFTLPAMTGTSLTGNQAYYTGTGGTGTSYAADGTAVLNYDNTATYPITIYLYDETNTTPNCFDEESFQLNIYPLPTATAPTSNLHTCDDGSGTNTGSFDTSLFESEVLGTQNPADYTVSYQDASDNALVISNPFVSQTQTVTAIVTNNTTNCTQEVDFDFIVDPLPIANAPTSNLEECDVNETGIADFDTSLLEQEILGTQSAADYSVSYQDALGTAIVMTNPFISATQTITAIVTNTSLATNCTNTVDFTLTVNPLPTATAPTSNLEACDDGNGTNTASFDTSLFESEVLGIQNPADFTVTYQDTADVDITMTNPFTSQTQTITAIVTNNTTNCIKEVDFTITVNPLPTANVPTNLHACDDGTGTAIFDTSDFISDILGLSQLPADYTITYTDQDTTPNPIAITYPTFTQSFAAGVSTLDLIATVTNNTTGCMQTVDFTLIKDDPDVSDFSYPATHICESDTANPFPIFTADTLFGGTFSILNTDGIDDGATIVSNTGEIDLSTTIAGQSYNISYDSTGALNSFCPTTTVFTITIDAEVFADFTYPDATVCIDDSNPVPTVTGLAGGTFVIDPASATIDAATGIIDLTTTEAGTTYTIYYTTPNISACTDTKSFDITVIGLPVFELDAQAYLCPDQDFVTLSVQNPSDTYTYEWVNANDTTTVIGVGETYNATEVGIYAVIATESVNFCTSTQIISVGMAEQAVITNVFVNDFNRPNNSIIVEVTGGTADFTYYLIDSDGNEVTHQENNPIFENVLPGTYEIRVEDNQGCSVVIYRTDIAILDYPRFFTPNGDGAYEYWQISNVTAIPYSNILIFDRFGKVLAQVDPNGPGWNGLYLGKPVPASDYWFTAEYLDPNTQLPRSVKGHFSIVRKSSFE